MKKVTIANLVLQNMVNLNRESLALKIMEKESDIKALGDTTSHTLSIIKGELNLLVYYRKECQDVLTDFALNGLTNKNLLLDKVNSFYMRTLYQALQQLKDDLILINQVLPKYKYKTLKGMFNGVMEPLRKR